MISDHVVFTSPAFPIEPGEDTETNPGIYGRALTTWVAQSLKRRGVAIDAIVVEDFGRCVMVRRKPFKLWVACASLDGSPTRWQMFIAVEQNALRKLFRPANPEPELSELRRHYRAILRDIPNISEIEWQDH